MNFQPELAAKVMAGEKTVTRRVVSSNPRSPWWRGGCKLKPGRTYAVCPGRGKPAVGRVEIVKVTEEAFHPSQITLAEARREGFASEREFEETWWVLNGHTTERVWRVEFRLREVRT